MPLSSRTRFRVRVDFPAPDGEDRIRRRPRRFRIDTPSLHVLNLFAKLVDDGFQFQAETGERDVARFGAERIGLTAELLREEIEPPSDRAAGRQERARPLDMGAEPVELLSNIGARR